MNKLTINSQESLQKAIGELGSLWEKHKFLKLSITAGKSRSLDQNAISFAWYAQIAKELNEDDAAGWCAYSKLHWGVPILRAEDEEYKIAYDAVIRPLSYENKITAMRCWPVTSLFTKSQFSKYLDAVQADFREKGVLLDYPTKDYDHENLR